MFPEGFGQGAGGTNVGGADEDEVVDYVAEMSV